MDIRIVNHGDNATRTVRNKIAAVAHEHNLKITIMETPFAEYNQIEKSGLVVIAYDISKPDVLLNSDMQALVAVLERADMEAPDVQLAILEDAVDSEVMDEWMEKLDVTYPILPFDPNKQPDVLDRACQPEIYVPRKHK